MHMKRRQRRIRKGHSLTNRREEPTDRQTNNKNSSTTGTIQKRPKQNQPKRNSLLLQYSAIVVVMRLDRWVAERSSSLLNNSSRRIAIASQAAPPPSMGGKLGPTAQKQHAERHKLSCIRTVTTSAQNRFIQRTQRERKSESKPERRENMKKSNPHQLRKPTAPFSSAIVLNSA